MNAKPKTKSFSMEYALPHPPEKVWRALTEPKLLAAWLMVTDLRPLVGNSFTFKADPTPWWDGIVHCEVLELDLHKRLRYSWRSVPCTPRGFPPPPSPETSRRRSRSHSPPSAPARA